MTTFDPFSLDDPTHPRQRYTKTEVKRGETERIQCRADSFHIRRIDEILAARIDPEFKTRSDVFQDAIAMWLEDWDRRYPDGAAGQLRYQSELANMERSRRHRTEFITNAEQELDGLREDADINGLRQYVQLMCRARGDFLDDAPATFMVRMDKMISESRRLVESYGN